MAEMEMLQWGSRISAAESVNIADKPHAELMLQWGSRISAAERGEQARRVAQQVGGLQWGRRISAAASS
ncbi:hypothetical protein [Sorangium sp. So ce1504]|uniref:hypothetical protein n=1 Tax=Sorangium sp. So ce1504 TaxID=3133337 RepID=UPI003F60D741